MDLSRALHTGLPVVALTLATATFSPGALAAQELRYTTVSEVEFGGQLGRIMRALPGGQDEVRETVWISGPRTRTDTDGVSTIVDLQEHRWVLLDHETRTYHELDVTDLGEAVTRVSAAMTDAREEAPGPERRQRADVGSDGAITRLDINVSTERTGDRREISGFGTERVFVVLDMKAEALAVAEDPDHPELQEGRVVLLTELWLTEEPLVPVPEDLDVEGYREMTGDAMESWAALEQVWANDPELRIAFDRSRAELDDLAGTAVESTLFWVTVPPQKSFDLQMALADRDRSLAADVADAAVESARESAKESVKRGLGRLGGGLFGGGDDEEEEVEEPELVQQTFLRIRTRLENVERGPIPASTFQVPGEYTLREFPAPGGTAGG